MRSSDVTTLIHLVGFVTGAVLYAMLGVMAARGRPSGKVGRLRGAGQDRMALATAALGLVWNAGGLLLYGVSDLGLGTPPGWAVALAFAALGFLPAVVVHSAAQNVPRQRGGRLLIAAAYAVSGAAAAIQFTSLALGGAAPSRSALLLLSAGYVGLTLGLAGLLRRQPGWRRGLSTAALAAFAVMALHLSQHGAAPDQWWLVLVGHHASIPLVLAILYQDYRFALADIFLKRALALVVLLLLSLAAYAVLLVPVVLPRLALDPLDPRASAALVTLWLVLAISYPALRRAVGRFVDRVVLRRADYRKVAEEIVATVATLEAEEDVLTRTCDLLAAALWAGDVTWAPAANSRSGIPPVNVTLRDGRQEATLAIATADPPAYVIEICSLAAGRVLLSDDLRVLETAAAVAGHRIDSIRLTRERVERRVRESEILQLATDAELRALRAQLNPHFLFNALNTIAYLMGTAPSRAQETIYRLTELLRAVLRRSEGTLVTLAQEIEIVEAYLAIEKARFEDRLSCQIEVPDELRPLAVPPLILQPLVENAVRHGIAPLAQGGRITITADRQRGPDASVDMLRLVVRDTGIGFSDAGPPWRHGGIGLSGIQRRLERQFGSMARLDVRGEPGVGTTVEIRLPLVTVGAHGTGSAAG
jgi:signal transduction histidine kinase